MKSLRHLAVTLLCTVGLCGLPASAVAQAPTIESEWVTDISSSDAVLRARIDPNGLLTNYKLQIDTTGHFSFFQTDGCALHPPGAVCTMAIVEGEPLPAGLREPPESAILAGTGGVEVAAYAGVLQPSTTYHFRAIAANSPGFVSGTDCTFTTPVEGEELPDVTCDQDPSTGGEDLPDPMPISDPLSIPAENQVAPTAPSPTPQVAPRKKHRRKPQRRHSRRAIHPASAVPAR